MFAGQGCDADPVPVRPADLLGDAELGVPRAPTGGAAGRPGGGQSFAGEFVLQVALELPDRDEHVDQHGGGRVGGGEVGDVRQGTGQHPQFHLVLLAPGAQGEDVGQVPTQPVQLGDGEPVAGPGVADQLPETGTLQRRDLRGGRRVTEQAHPVGGVGESGLAEKVGLPLRALLVGRDSRVDQIRHDRAVSFIHSLSTPEVLPVSKPCRQFSSARIGSRTDFPVITTVQWARSDTCRQRTI